LLGWPISSYNMVISMLFIEITDSPADPETERDSLSCQLAPFQR